MKDFLTSLVAVVIETVAWVFGGGLMIMWGWNSLLPPIFSITGISYAQGCQIIVLCLLVSTLLRGNTNKGEQK